MEMRIVVPDAGGVGALADQLVTAFGRDCVSFRADRPEVAVRVAGESDGTVLGVLDTVERWLDQAGLAAAEMWLGGNSYRLARSVPVVEVWQ
jgi:hypothetical protein